MTQTANYPMPGSTKTPISSVGQTTLGAGAASKTITDSNISASSIILVSLGTHDATCYAVHAVPGTGSFTIYPNAVPTGAVMIHYIITY